MTKESQGFLFGFLLPMMMLLSFVLPLKLVELFAWMPSYWPTFGAFVALWTIPLFSFYPIKLRKAKQKVRAGLDAIPTSLRSFHVRERMHALLQRHKRPTPLESFHLEKVRQHMDVNALPRLPEGFGGIFSESQGLNMIPATKIEARNGHDVRVMQPLLALPAPSPVDDVVVPMRAAFSKT